MPTTVKVALVGPGLVGSAFLSQLSAQAEALAARHGLQVVVDAVCSSRKALCSSSGVSLNNFKQELPSQSASEASGLQLLANFLSSSSSKPEPRIIVDCTASEDVADLYEDWSEMGCHIVTPNKRMGSGNWSRWRSFQSTCASAGVHFFCEATVGAGLPVISTLRSLLDTGDRVVRIEGVLSGTLSYLFSTYQPPSNSFSQVVAAAKEAGYTEPDPRDDLSGMDVARKVVILARECGMEARLENLQVASLVPSGLEKLPWVDDFMAELPKHDGAMEAEAASAAAEGKVIRYVGVVDVEAGTCEVALRRYPRSHPFAQLQGSDNMISFTTARYSGTPLIVRGPGAGAEVTAAGVFGDVLQAARLLAAGQRRS